MCHNRYKIVTMARKTSKICLVCGKDFDGTAAKMTCSDACRTAMFRMASVGKKPEFYLIAKSKGQKVPNFGKKKEAVVPTITEAPKEINKEPIAVIKEPELTKEQKMAKIQELEKEITNIGRERCPSNQHPKTFILNQEIRISDIKDQINKLQL